MGPAGGRGPRGGAARGPPPGPCLRPHRAVRRHRRLPPGRRRRAGRRPTPRVPRRRRLRRGPPARHRAAAGRSGAGGGAGQRPGPPGRRGRPGQRRPAGSRRPPGVEDGARRDRRRRALVTGPAAAAPRAAPASVARRGGGGEPAIAAGITLVLLLGTAGLGAATWRPEALSQPTYTGLLVNANSLIGNAQDIVARFDAYRASLEDLVANVGTLYATISALPAPGGTGRTVALLHVSDLHLNPAGFDLVEQVVTQFHVDGVLDTGDITDWGSQPENQLISSVGDLDVPYVYIRGNHDSPTTAALFASQPNATVLDDSVTTVAGIEIAGMPDPLFTPDKSTGDDHAGDDLLAASGKKLADLVDTLPEVPDIALVHDPKQAAPLDGAVPLVLAGHTHKR